MIGTLAKLHNFKSVRHSTKPEHGYSAGTRRVQIASAQIGRDEGPRQALDVTFQ